MNFFGFNSISRRIVIGKDFWIFVATWLPLTIITISIYLFVIYMDFRKKGKKVKWPWSRTTSHGSVKEAS